MALLGCRLIGLDDPSSHDQIKKLIVYIEMDRCAADAVAHVTGVRLGRRSLKFMDYGIMAATFVNLETDLAFRVLSTEDARSLVPVYAPEIVEKSKQQLEAYMRMPDSVLFRVQKVQTTVDEVDLPGPTRKKVPCSRCGQVVRDGREVIQDGQILCRPCTREVYFSNAKEVSWSNMNWMPEPSDITLRANRQTRIRSFETRNRKTHEEENFTGSKRNEQAVAMFKLN
jgi:formylmethanofuran dehydrogenase subunit E